jgi:iron complex outermembrane receptor protein
MHIRPYPDMPTPIHYQARAISFVGCSKSVGVEEMNCLHKSWLVAVAALGFSLALPFQGIAQDDFEGFDLEALMDVEVFSVSKKAQSLADSAAAVYVLNQEDIKRSGATSIPELMRLVPGMEVGSIDSSTWAVTARGFNGRFSNKLLVLIDGRSVYSPLFAGVHWALQDTMLEDIDRIEIIRGPGGTIWGANAVNGVINIITKSPVDTLGALVSAGGGTYEHGFVNVRQGTKIAESGHLRIYGKYFDRDHFENAPGDSSTDEWDQARVGFRAEWDLDEVSTLTVQGDVYEGDALGAITEPIPTPPYTQFFPEQKIEKSGGNALFELRRWLGDDNVVEFKAYYDTTTRGPVDGFVEKRDTLDATFQQNVAFANSFDLIWGFGYRLNSSHLEQSFVTGSVRPDERNPLYSAFVQGELKLAEDKLRLTLGSKFEHNDFTGFEWQPSARVLLRPNDENTVWAAISRAVRTPSNAETSIRSIVSTQPVAALGLIDPALAQLAPILQGICAACDSSFGFAGVDSYDSEEVIAYEAGWRGQVTPRFNLDIAAYFNEYDDLRTTEIDYASINPLDPLASDTIGFDPINNLTQIWLTTANNMEGIVYGAEVAAAFQPTDSWKVRSGYNYIKLDLELDANVEDPASLAYEHASPHHQVFAHSMVDLPNNVSFDTIVRWKDRISAHDVDSAFNLDTRIAWKPVDQLEISCVGQNLLSPSEREFQSIALIGNVTTRAPRGVYGKITWTP